MDFGKAFSYITEDEGWITKILIASVILLVGTPILGLGFIVLAGWGAEIIRRVSNDEAEALPAWDDFGKYIVDGLKVFGLSLVWSLPIILIYGCSFGIIFGLTAMDLDSDIAGPIALLANGCSVLFVVLYSIVIAFLLPSSVAILANGGSFGDALRNAFSVLRANIGGFVIAVIVGNLVISLLGSLGIILCGIGSVVGSAYGAAVYAHLVGQAYKEASGATPELAAAG